MSSLLPESGKPIDLDQTMIHNADDAGIVLKWLDDLIVDMQHQILQHLTGSQLDLDWLTKVRSALRATIRTRFQVAETKARFEHLQDKRATTFVKVAEELFGHNAVENVWDEVEKRLRARSG